MSIQQSINQAAQLAAFGYQQTGIPAEVRHLNEIGKQVKKGAQMSESIKAQMGALINESASIQNDKNLSPELKELKKGAYDARINDLGEVHHEHLEKVKGLAKDLFQTRPNDKTLDVYLDSISNFKVSDNLTKIKQAVSKEQQAYNTSNQKLNDATTLKATQKANSNFNKTRHQVNAAKNKKDR